MYFLPKNERENFPFEACSEMHLESLFYIIVVCWSIKCTSSDQLLQETTFENK